MPDHPAQLIIHALREAPWPRTTDALAAATGLRQPQITKLLDGLCDRGVVQRVKRGVYRLPNGEG